MPLRKVVLLVLIMLMMGVAWAASSSILAKYDPDMDWFSAGEGEFADIPDGLNEREAQIFREAYALGHYHALHPEYVEGVYVVNTRTKKFHFTDCKNTLLIDASNRLHTTDTKEELVNDGYEPCGSCKP